MQPTKLPLEAVPPTKRGAKATYAVELLPYIETTVSPKSPRFDYVITDGSVAALASELKAVGQAHDAIGEQGYDGRVEILAGSSAYRCAYGSATA